VTASFPDPGYLFQEHEAGIQVQRIPFCRVWATPIFMASAKSSSADGRQLSFSVVCKTGQHAPLWMRQPEQPKQFYAKVQCLHVFVEQD